ncbi:RNA-directed DNA polymerase from mobile element jockey [Eumeta japonica]|uniref:RNA-directed DNA polymerase from mobile element jockey n=1 Tax=Eumeta variegata TaxID=151549 RepID=A0A4C1UCG0_EUMVA|nr:RNA-directed DNA polymerase from mobile element jockey [Eumeta japonica]
MHPNGKAHGGSAILIKSTIKHYQSQPHCKDYIQATNVVVSAGVSDITISSLYCPPRHTIKEQHFNDYFKTLGKRFIAAGDYNAKHTFWGSRLTLPRGRELLKSAQSGHMNIISTGQPTYWPTDKDKIPDIVDFCIFKGIANTNISCSSCWDLSSDHSPILVEITAEIRETTRDVPYIINVLTGPYFVPHRRGIQRTYCSSNKGDIVDAVEYFTTSVQSAAWNSTPINQHKLTEQHIPTNILQKISEKRALRKLWQQNRCPETKKRLNHKIKELKRILNNDRNVRFQAYLESLDPTAATDYSLWKATKKIKRPTVNSPLRKPDGSWAR